MLHNAREVIGSEVIDWLDRAPLYVDVAELLLFY